MLNFRASKLEVKEKKSRKLIFWQRFEKVDLYGWQDKEYIQSRRQVIIIAAHCNLEVKLKSIKQCFDRFCYCFWSKAVLMLDRYCRKITVDPLELLKDEQERTKILKTLKAMEGFVLFSSIVMGITHMLCSIYEGKI